MFIFITKYHIYSNNLRMRGLHFRISTTKNAKIQNKEFLYICFYLTDLQYAPLNVYFEGDKVFMN